MDTRQEVAKKIDWEGGLVAAIEYGLTPDDMPEGDAELRDAWDRWMKHYEVGSAICKDLARLLPKVA